MISALLDYGSSLRGVSLIFRRGLQLQARDLLRSSEPFPPSAAAASFRSSSSPSTLPASSPYRLTTKSFSTSPPSPATKKPFQLDLRPAASRQTPLPASDTSSQPTSVSPNSVEQPSDHPISGSPSSSTSNRSPPTSASAIDRSSSSLPTSSQSPSSSSLAPSAGSYDPTPDNLASSDSSVTTDPTTSLPDLSLAEDEDLPEEVVATLKASKVPSSRIGRLFHYGSLVTSLSFGAASEAVRRSTASSSTGSQGSLLFSESNLNRLVDKLGQMRGAALKLGQFMSIQDSGALPPELEKVLRRVQAGADYMPDWQMQKVMSSELGAEWRSRFTDFSSVPMASASIGQVHSGSITRNGVVTPVAVKIQFPGVSTSISSDLSNLALLLRTSALLPKGLFLDNTLRVMRGELEDECDYVREADCARRFGEFLGVGERGEEGNKGGFFRVPRIIDELSTSNVLTMERMEGVPLSRVGGLSQEKRNLIGSSILRLCLQELFHFRLMQTDPNWSNFLFNKKTDQIELIDFGATREYGKPFMDDWYRLLKAAISDDKEAMELYSLKLGYLTGKENPEMLAAHITSMSLLGTPFRRNGSSQEPFEFKDQTITTQVKALIPVMLKHRLTPPPTETYSLNRKLSGAFLLCAKLGSQVRCADLWDEIVANYVCNE